MLFGLCFFHASIQDWHSSLHLVRQNLLMTCLKHPQVALIFNPAVALRLYTFDPTTVYIYILEVSHCQRAHMKKGLKITVSDTILQS